MIGAAAFRLAEDLISAGKRPAGGALASAVAAPVSVAATRTGTAAGGRSFTHGGEEDVLTCAYIKEAIHEGR